MYRLLVMIILSMKQQDKNKTWKISENVYSSNAIFPYNLCYINIEGEIFIPGNNPKRCLDYFKKLCLGKNEVLPDLIAGFDKETKASSKMDLYAQLLQATITHLKG